MEWGEWGIGGRFGRQSAQGRSLRGQRSCFSHGKAGGAPLGLVDENGTLKKQIEKRADSDFSEDSSRIRVLMLGHQFQVPTEGQAKAEALCKHQDLEILVVTPDRYCEGETHWRYPVPPATTDFQWQVQRVHFPWSGLGKWYLQWYAGLAETVRRFQPDVIDVWEEPWNLLSAQVCLVRKRHCPRAVLISETEQNINRVLPPPFEWFRKYTLREADFLIGRSREAVQVAKNKGYEGPARVVGNGVDTQLFSPQNREASRERFGMTGFAVGYAGRLVSEKGVLDLVQAFDALPSDTGLWLCGDGALMSSLREKGDRVHLMGSLRRKNLAEFFSSIDVLVLPSRTTATWKEQFGRVLIEAQACGTPVIASRSGAIPEVLGNSAILYTEGSIAELADALQKLRGDAELRQTMAEAGRARVGAFYSWDSIALQMRDVYRECIKRSRSDSRAFPVAKSLRLDGAKGMQGGAQGVSEKTDRS